MTPPARPPVDSSAAGGLGPLLRVQDLRTYFHLGGAVARAVDGVSFEIHAGETVGMVGESGCGKSVTALSLLRLVDPPGRIEPGSSIEFEGRDLLRLDEEGIRQIRGNRIAMVFQEPMTALNPVFTIGDQVAEVARVHAGASRRAAWERAVEMLNVVGIPDPRERAKSYPHQLSGGMRQRAVIAIALALRPGLLILDESTAALDVLVQQQLLDQLSALQAELGFAVLFISHDLPLTLSWCGRVGVLYAGRLVEIASAAQLAATPQHPYTQGLIRCFVDPRAPRPTELRGIPGLPPDPRHLPSGCPFHPRCPVAFDRCPRERPALLPLARPRSGPPAGDDDRRAACHLVT